MHLIVMADPEDLKNRIHSFTSGIRIHHLVGGLCGGVVATLVTHPFDLIKLRLAGKSPSPSRYYFGTS